MCLRVKEKLLSFATVLAGRGYLAAREVEVALGKAGMPQGLDAAFTEVQKWRNRAAQLAREKDLLGVELSNMERRFGSEREKARRERRNREHLEMELSEAHRALSRAKEKIDSLEAQVDELQSEAAFLETREVGIATDEEEESKRSPARALRKLVNAIEPLITQVEFIAMDDADVSERLKVVQDAVEEARKLL